MTDEMRSIITTLKKDATSLTNEVDKAVKSNDTKVAIDKLRLLKDTLYLIKEYGEEFDMESSLTINAKGNDIIDSIIKSKIVDYCKFNECYSHWYHRFVDAIENKKSCVIDLPYGNGYECFHRGSGKTYTLLQIAKEYDGKCAFLVNEIKNMEYINDNIRDIHNSGFRTIELKDKAIRENLLSDTIIHNLRQLNSAQFRGRIILLDEQFSDSIREESLNRLKETRIVIGFRKNIKGE